MARSHNALLELYPATFNEQEFSSANHLSKALQTESEWLSPMVTHAYGSSGNFGRRNFPLSFVTEGMGRVRSISTTDLSYKVAIIGRPKKASAIAVNAASVGETPGRGHAEVEVIFRDRLFHKSMTIYSPSRVECRVQDDGENVPNRGWKFRIKMMNPNADASIPVRDLQRGVRWGRGIAKVGKERSRGVRSTSYNPFATTNQLSVVRDSYNIAGNVQNKVMVLKIKADGQEFKYWTQWELFLRQLEWKEKCESDLWYSEYNKDANGVIHVIDEDSGEVVPSGAGMLQQIPNEDSYAMLTTQKIESLITDIFFNASDADIVEVDIYTGTGGMREASRAMEKATSAFSFIDTQQVTKKADGNLAFGAYYNEYRHRDGHTVRFKTLPLMDRGVYADISDPHPNDGLPLESYNMYCVDNSVYDGEPNLQYVSEAGRESQEFVVAGATVPAGYGDTMFRSSDIDASSVQWMKSQGIQIMKPTNCFKMFNRINQL